MLTTLVFEIKEGKNAQKIKIIHHYLVFKTRIGCARGDTVPSKPKTYFS